MLKELKQRKLFGVLFSITEECYQGEIIKSSESLVRD